MPQRLDTTASPAITRLVTADPALANRHAPPGWRQRIARLGPGPFEYAYERVDLDDGVRVAHVRYSGAVRVVGTLRTRAVQLLFAAGDRTRVGGVPLQGDGAVALTIGPCAADTSTQFATTNYNIQLTDAAYDALLAAIPLLAAQRPPFAPGRRVFARGAEARQLRAEIESFIALAAQHPDAVLRPAQRARSRATLIGGVSRVLQALALDGEPIASPQPRGRALALAVERWVWECVAAGGGASVSLDSASAATGYSIRSLQLAVEEHFGTTFVKYVRAARLHHVHEELLRHGGRRTVSEVASRYGFCHLGRFSHYYREMYGQAPSETAGALRRRAAYAAPPRAASLEAAGRAAAT